MHKPGTTVIDEDKALDRQGAKGGPARRLTAGCSSKRSRRERKGCKYYGVGPGASSIGPDLFRLKSVGESRLHKRQRHVAADVQQAGTEQTESITQNGHKSKRGHNRGRPSSVARLAAAKPARQQEGWCVPQWQATRDRSQALPDCLRRPASHAKREKPVPSRLKRQAGKSRWHSSRLGPWGGRP